jgi:hypothetical protein
LKWPSGEKIVVDFVGEKAKNKVAANEDRKLFVINSFMFVFVVVKRRMILDAPINPLMLYVGCIAPAMSETEVKAFFPKALRVEFPSQRKSER